MKAKTVHFIQEYLDYFNKYFEGSIWQRKKYELRQTSTLEYTPDMEKAYEEGFRHGFEAVTDDMRKALLLCMEMEGMSVTEVAEIFQFGKLNIKK